MLNGAIKRCKLLLGSMKTFANSRWKPRSCSNCFVMKYFRSPVSFLSRVYFVIEFHSQKRQTELKVSVSCTHSPSLRPSPATVDADARSRHLCCLCTLCDFSHLFESPKVSRMRHEWKCLAKIWIEIVCVFPKRQTNKRNAKLYFSCSFSQTVLAWFTTLARVRQWRFVWN